MTADIAAEWNEHQSSFARRWRVSMTASRRVRRLSLEHNDDLRRKIGSTADNASQREAMLKDCHLLEAALATDNTIVSLDEAARELFSAAAQTVGELRGVVWANPDRVEEGVESWLASGARPERRRFLWQPA